MTVLNFGLLLDFQAKQINVTEHPLRSCVLGAYEKRGEIPKNRYNPFNRAYTCQCRKLIRDSGLIPGSGSSPGEGNGNPLQYSCLENPKDRGAWRATARGVIKSWTQLSD